MPQWATARLAVKGAWVAAVAMAIAIMLGLLAVQSIRLEGFKIWPIDVEGWKPKAERLQATIDNITAAQDLAEQNARTARLEDEAEYRGIT